ncbi:MAG: L-cysteine desulfidase family protein [Treponema sp.]
MNDKIESLYVKILEEELKPALGCTEPIAISFLAASLRHYMSSLPDSLLVEASGNIIKNAKSVVVPNTSGMKGIIVAASAGIVAGDAEAGLEVLKAVKEEDIPQIKTFIEKTPITLKKLESPSQLHIKMKAVCGKDIYEGELRDQHTNITEIKKNDSVIYSGNSKAESGSAVNTLTDRSVLNVKDILEFASSVSLDKVSHLIERQIEYNTKIAKAGLTEHYGIDIGRNFLKLYQEGHEYSIRMLAVGEAAAASDARMCGCPIPVVTNSGSGNQGLTVSIPVIVYAREMKVSHEKLIRTLLISNLLAIHQKTAIGRLSAYCGAVTAGTAAAAAIAYMLCSSYDVVCKTITTSLATTSGMFCDGAKQSCSNKIVAVLETSLFAMDMAVRGNTFDGGDGIVKEDIEKTIKGVGTIASKGMLQTDKVILDVMLE